MKIISLDIARWLRRLRLGQLTDFDWQLIDSALTGKPLEILSLRQRFERGDFK